MHKRLKKIKKENTMFGLIFDRFSTRTKKPDDKILTNTSLFSSKPFSSDSSPFNLTNFSNNTPTTNHNSIEQQIGPNFSTNSTPNDPSRLTHNPQKIKNPSPIRPKKLEDDQAGPDYPSFGGNKRFSFESFFNVKQRLFQVKSPKRLQEFVLASSILNHLHKTWALVWIRPKKGRF